MHAAVSLHRTACSCTRQARTPPVRWMSAAAGRGSTGSSGSWPPRARGERGSPYRGGFNRKGRTQQHSRGPKGQPLKRGPPGSHQKRGPPRNIAQEQYKADQENRQLSRSIDFADQYKKMLAKKAGESKRATLRKVAAAGRDDDRSAPAAPPARQRAQAEQELNLRRLEEERDATRRVTRPGKPKRALRFNTGRTGAEGKAEAYQKRQHERRAQGERIGEQRQRAAKKQARADEASQIVTFEDWQAQQAKAEQREGRGRKPRKPRKVDFYDQISVRDLAEKMRVQIRHLQNALTELGEKDLGRSREPSEALVPQDVAELAILEFGMEPRETVAPAEVFGGLFGDLEDLVATPRGGGPDLDEDAAASLAERPPVVAVMGHVNHGKTSLLDAIRLRHGGPGPGADVEPGYIPDADAPPAVTATVEAGDITQAMSAFSVDLGGRQRGAFIDTPGHAAFARMRERGVMVTDVALVVVDAVQGVQNQTRETLQLLAQTKPPTPVVLALNKCDLLAPHEVEAARAKVSTQIMELGFATEEHGGDVQMVGVSAKTSQGLGDLEEAVLLQAEMSELRAAPKEARGEAVVLEARTEPGVGPTVDALVTWGGLAVGDHVVCGHEWGKVRELTGTFGRAIGPEGAGASEPVRLVGLSGVPSAGDELIQARDEEHAKRVAEARAARSAARAEAEEAARIAAERQRHDERRRALEAAVAARQRELGRRLRPAERTELTDAFKRDADARFAAASVAKTGAAAPIPTASLAAGSARGDADAASAAASAIAEAVDAHDPDKPAVSVLLKADSDGALETMLAEIEAIPQRKLSLRVVGRGVGPVTKRDLFKAETHGAAIFGFNVKVPRKMQDLADQENIAIRTDPIIYTVVDQLREHMQEALPPVTEESLLGQAKVLQTFEITKAGRRTFEVAGVKVFSGEIKRNSKFRLLRGKDVVFEARRLASMRHFKERVNVMKQGSECAVALEGWEERDAADESLQFREGDVLQSFEEVQKKQSLV